MQVATRTLQIGPYQIKPIPTGIFRLDGGAMFGTVPKVLWEKTNPADNLNRIEMEARALLLLSDKHKVLIDTGVGSDFTEKYGEKLGPKFAEIYGVDSSGTSLESSLSKLGLKPEDITEVILTHLHFDHAGGATRAADGKLVPTFPNARYFIQRANLETAQNPNVRERASYFAASYQPLLDADVVQILDGSVKDLLPGVSVSVSNGHTQGQQVVKVSDGKTGLIYCGDVIPTSTHVRLPWVMGYDLQPLILIEEKKRLLEPASKENCYLFFEHDPYCDAASVEANKNDFTVKERIRLV